MLRGATSSSEEMTELYGGKAKWNIPLGQMNEFGRGPTPITWATRESEGVVRGGGS